MSASSPAQTTPVRILMVCMGNICRSPTAQGVLERLLAQQGLQHSITVDSAGTHDYHIGRAPDSRSQRHALARGYDLSGQRARQLQRQDFTAFDWILVMDAGNEHLTRGLCPPQYQHKIRRLASFCQTHIADEVPDPYYGGAAGFEAVLDLCEDACAGLIQQLQQQQPHKD